MSNLPLTMHYQLTVNRERKTQGERKTVKGEQFYG